MRTVPLVLAISLVVSSASLAQMRRRGGTMSGRPGSNPNANAGVLGVAVATFDGTLKVVDKKKIMLEIGEDKTLTLTVNKKTEFRDGDKLLKPAEVAAGTLATVEAHKELGELIALVVRLKGRDPRAPGPAELKTRQ